MKPSKVKESRVEKPKVKQAIVTESKSKQAKVTESRVKVLNNSNSSNYFKNYLKTDKNKYNF